MSLIEWLDKLDKRMFTLIQGGPDYEWLDIFFLVVRDAFTWIPLYLFILYFVYTRNKNKVWLFVMCSIISFTITDRVSAGLLKPFFERPRPCFDETLQPVIRHLIDCGGMYSLPSSHAANHFGLAAFWLWSISSITGKRWIWLWIWAALIGYAQVYVAKHYPFDILVGALLGLITGAGLYWIMKHWPSPEK